MPAYVVFIRESEIRHPEEMDKYQQVSRTEMKPHPLTPLAVYGQQETIEGEDSDGIVILEFPDMDAAKNWYYSPEYQKAAKHRRAAADYRGFIVEGFNPTAGD